MAQSSIASDIHEAFDILLDFAAQIALHFETAVHDNGADAANFFFAQIFDAGVDVHIGGGKNLF